MAHDLRREIKLLREDVAAEVDAADAAKEDMILRLASFDQIRGRLKSYLQRIDLLAEKHFEVVEENDRLAAENAALKAKLAAAGLT